jgi:hypothetical protein
MSWPRGGAADHAGRREFGESTAVGGLLGDIREGFVHMV